MNNGKVCIGLFGTCDNIPWRVRFIEHYTGLGIEYFNPDAGDHWHPGLVEGENRHLREDEIILFPVLAESLGVGSLGEIGFSVLNVMRMILNGQKRYLVILIDDDCNDMRKDEGERKTSERTRALVKSKVLEYKDHPNIYLVETLNGMFDLSLELYQMLTQQIRIEDVFKSA